MEWLGLANSATTCADTRPITERVFCSPHGPTAPPHDPALLTTCRCADSSSMAEPEDNNATHSGPTDAHARPAPPGGGAPFCHTARFSLGARRGLDREQRAVS